MIYAPSPLNEVDDGIPVLSSGRYWCGTSPLIRFRLLRKWLICGSAGFLPSSQAAGHRSLRSGVPVRKRRLGAVLQGPLSYPEHESPGELFRQHCGGIVFQQFEERADPKEILSFPGGGTGGRVRLHRGLLQSNAPAHPSRAGEFPRLRKGTVKSILTVVYEIGGSPNRPQIACSLQA